MYLHAYVKLNMHVGNKCGLWKQINEYPGFIKGKNISPTDERISAS
jgi:hypothetical protein